jgi:exodeoxyribonuclease VII large subunit
MNQQPGLFNPATLTVSELTRFIMALLESEPVLQDIWVEGEVSNLKYHTSGHVYLSLKDETATLRCVIWKTYVPRLRIKLQEGMAITAHGRIGVYDRGGDYQLYIDSVQAVGEGALFQEFLRLKAQLEDEGLFAPEQKKELPEKPGKIGIVTSSTGAALQDMLNIFRQRYPLVEILLAPAAVQGTAAPAEIVSQIQVLNQIGVDVIILARGGGSIEDLWVFNDERVVRAVAGSSIPVITGIGHETDFTLADFAADVRAPTPTAAAVLAVPDILEIKAELDAMQTSLYNSASQAVQERRVDTRESMHALARLSPMNQLQNERQHIDTLLDRGMSAAGYGLQLLRSRLEGNLQHLRSVSPQAVLERGFALVFSPGGELLKSACQVNADMAIRVKLHDGTLDAQVNKVKLNQDQAGTF